MWSRAAKEGINLKVMRSEGSVENERNKCINQRKIRGEVVVRADTKRGGVVQTKKDGAKDRGMASVSAINR